MASMELTALWNFFSLKGVGSFNQNGDSNGKRALDFKSDNLASESSSATYPGSLDHIFGIIMDLGGYHHI